jgi:hypothetical protein
LIAKDMGNESDLVIDCYGKAEYFEMTDKLEREFSHGMAQVATTQDGMQI